MSVRILTGPGLTEPPTPVVSLNPHITPRGTLSIEGVEIPAIAAKTDNRTIIVTLENGWRVRFAFPMVKAGE